MLDLPARSTSAPGGTEFARKIAALPLAEREKEIKVQIVAGNLPDFLRRLCPVPVTNTIAGRTHTAVFYVTPDYLAVGSDEDYFLAPMSPQTAQQIADALHCSLPTPRMVDSIHHAAAVKLAPSPIPPNPQMTSVAVFSNHNATVRAQRAAHLAEYPLGALVAGHKKDVVLTARLAYAPGKVAIYGWHQTNGVPIQPLYLGHAASWVDYSQCIRLVSDSLLVDGQPYKLREVLANPELVELVSDEGVILSVRYPTNTGAFEPSPWFHERIAWLDFDRGVRVQVNAPAVDSSGPREKPLLVFYALPNGNTIEQTVGKQMGPGDDWHFNIQHIGAQTRFLRHALPDRSITIAYLENSLKSWPAWRRKFGDQQIPEILETVKRLVPGPGTDIVLSGHSGGGSLIFGYLNTVEKIPNQIVRIAFLDANYAYDTTRHAAKLATWLAASQPHFLCVLAYNDAAALLNGKPFVSAAGGTWGKSHEMLRDLSQSFSFNSVTNSGFERSSAIEGRVQFILKENPDRKIFHTVQVERNGFIHALLCGTPLENHGYDYFGPPAYSQWIAPK